MSSNSSDSSTRRPTRPSTSSTAEHPFWTRKLPFTTSSSSPSKNDRRDRVFAPSFIEEPYVPSRHLADPDAHRFNLFYMGLRDSRDPIDNLPQLATELLQSASAFVRTLTGSGSSAQASATSPVDSSSSENSSPSSSSHVAAETK